MLVISVRYNENNRWRERQNNNNNNNDNNNNNNNNNISKNGKNYIWVTWLNMEKLVFWCKKVNAAIFITVFRAKNITFIKDNEDIIAYWEEYKQKE